MQELVDAAVAAAGRTGAKIAVIVADGKATNGAAPGGDAAALTEARNRAGIAEANLRTTYADLDKANAQVKDLAARLDAMGKAAPGNVIPFETAQKMQALEKELGEARAKLAAAPAGGIPLGAPQPDALPKLRDYKIDILGLDAELVKKAGKANIATIGALEDLALAPEKDKLKDALKLTKDQVTEVHAALLRRSRASDAPVPAGALAQTSASAGGATDVPHGHTDLPWMERLKKLRVQYGKYVTVGQESDAAKAALTAKWPAARQLYSEGADEPYEVTVLPPNLPPQDFPAFFEAAMRLAEKERLYQIYGAHVIALRVALNLPRDLKTARTPDDALKAAGLVHLMETPPATAPAGSPAGSPPTGSPAGSPPTGAAATPPAPTASAAK